MTPNIVPHGRARKVLPEQRLQTTHIDQRISPDRDCSVQSSEDTELRCFMERDAAHEFKFEAVKLVRERRVAVSIALRSRI